MAEPTNKDCDAFYGVLQRFPYIMDSPEARSIVVRAAALEVANKFGISEQTAHLIADWDPRTDDLEHAVPALARLEPVDRALKSTPHVAAEEARTLVAHLERASKEELLEAILYFRRSLNNTKKVAVQIDPPVPDGGPIEIDAPEGGELEP